MPRRTSATSSGSSGSSSAPQSRKEASRLRVLVAAADALAEPPALVREAAARAGGRQDPRLDQQRAHQGRPEERIGNEDRAGHGVVIGSGGLNIYPRVSSIRLGL